MPNTIARVIVTLLATFAALIGAIYFASPANAAAKPSKTDKAVMVQANRACTSVPGESEYEACVVGAFILMRHRYIDERFYAADYSDSAPGEPCDHCIVLTKKSKKA